MSVMQSVFMLVSLSAMMSMAFANLPDAVEDGLNGLINAV